jgi:hypothetical protein
MRTKTFVVMTKTFVVRMKIDVVLSDSWVNYKGS